MSRSSPPTPVSPGPVSGTSQREGQGNLRGPGTGGGEGGRQEGEEKGEEGGGEEEKIERMEVRKVGVKRGEGRWDKVDNSIITLYITLILISSL